jgi:type IV pilus assembly protein PilB
MLLPDEQLKQLILSSGVEKETLDEAEEFAKNSQTSLSEALIEKKVITDENLGLLIANYLKFPFINLAKITIPEEAFRVVPERIARKFKVLSFARDTDGVKLAMVDPKNTEIVNMLVKKTGVKVTPYLATERDLENAFQVYRKELQKKFDELLEREVGVTTLAGEDLPLIKIVDLLITYAYRDKASDIHIEPEEKDVLIRFRVDGILHDVLRVDKRLHERIISRIKVLSRLRTDEHLSAQDGKMRMRIDDEDLDLRVSIIPVADGEKAVLRLLTSRFRQFALLDLGIVGEDLKKVNSSINKSYGMILSTGPTGCGKTTSIYAILKILNTREKNITTIEDPVEYRIKGINQIQVNARTNLTFANGLRSILRQDPNVIFVGEIRDKETAGIAVNAALTGHLVLSTLHTNNASTALPRLIDMEIEPFLVASTVNIIVAQRLVRKICPSCKMAVSLKREEALKNISAEYLNKYFKDEKEIVIYQGKGCKACHFTGYSGRIGLFEVLELTERIKKLIVEKSDSDVIEKEAIAEGMTTMVNDGIFKIAQGLTTLKEVMRVTKTETL